MIISKHQHKWDDDKLDNLHEESLDSGVMDPDEMEEDAVHDGQIILQDSSRIPIVYCFIHVLVASRRSSKSSSARINTNVIFSGAEEMKRKSIGRKMDLTFYRQLSYYGWAGCGKMEDRTKEVLDGFKMAKV